MVFGASGLIGRHLVLALTREGVRVSTANRSSASYRRLAGWLDARGGGAAPADLRVDFSRPSLFEGVRQGEGVREGEGQFEFEEITEVHNCAGAYRFGMSAREASEANVDSVRAVVAFAARLPRLRRLVQVSGYRVGGQEPGPWSAERRRDVYRELGAYEASRVEADAVFRTEVERLGVPWSVVNPASVIGDSATGESDQYLGLAQSVRDLWRGSLAALPGDGRTFVPVVAVDYLARFMALLPADESTEGGAYWLLDDETPALPDLLTLVAERYRVRAPRTRIPVSLVRRLPRRITRADPETLTFLSSDRYPTGSARALAARHGLTEPDTVGTILRWADHLAAHRFGDAVGGGRRFTEVGGVRTFELGERGASTVVLPGLPVNADTWAPVVDALGDARAVDLPGLGMSAGGVADWPSWLAALWEGGGVDHLVGHSVGAAAAVEAATARPEAVRRLTLVAPFFLRAPGARVARWAPASRWYLRRVSPEALADRLTGGAAPADAVRSSVADLRRGAVAATVARLLAAAGQERWREELRGGLRRFPGDVHVVVGAGDPLAPEGLALLEALPRVTVTEIDGAGHHPQLTRPRDVARVVGAHRAVRGRGSGERPRRVVTNRSATGES
ncbi:hypothetical protein GCM10022227_52830 [Streptomyces sedi]